MSGWLHEHLEQVSPDLLRAMVRSFAQALMGAEAGTRAGSIELQVPKLRQGSYFPGWLLERRRGAEAALVSVVATSYMLGVSTRRVEKLVQQPGVTSLSKSQVSEMARDLDAQVEAFGTRPLDAGPYTFAAADALVLKVREAGRTVSGLGFESP